MIRQFRFGSLFSGIGGIDLGFERAGMVCAWQVEKDWYARKILEKHWPKIRRIVDVKNAHSACQYCKHAFGLGRCQNCLEKVDLIAGGFPCQGLSIAGKGKGLKDSRSGLWVEFARIIEDCAPAWVVIENVPALKSRGLRTILNDLDARGYNARWDCVPASRFGAHHVRDRLFVVAWHVSNPVGERVRFESEWYQWPGWDVRAAIGKDPEPLEHGALDGWSARPALSRMGYGLSADVDRARCLGNAVVPQVARYIGQSIMAAEAFR